MSTIEYKILDKLAEMDEQEAQFKKLVLNALSYLMARNYVMGTSDAGWYREWQTEVYRLLEQLKATNESASD